MEPARFFYSMNGADVHGPVTEDELRQLLDYKIIGPATYLCREGESEWQLLNPEALRSSAVVPPPEPYSPPYVPPAAALSQMRDVYLDELWTEGILRIILIVICWLVTIGGAITLVVVQADHPGRADPISHHLISFAEAVAFIFLVPYLISLPFKRGVRLLIRGIGMWCLAFLVIQGQLERNRALKLDDMAIVMSNQMKAEARKQIAEKGRYDGNLPQAEANMQKLKEQADQDHSQASRLMRAAVVVSQEIVEKINASVAAENACGSFDPATLNSLADVNNLRTAVTKLRATQADVLSEFESYDDLLRDALAKDNVSAYTINQAIAGARKGGHVDEAIAAWQLKIKLSDDHLSRLDFLEKSWGSWNSKDGKLLFSDKDSRDAYNNLTINLQNDVKDIGDLQKRIVQ